MDQDNGKRYARRQRFAADLAIFVRQYARPTNPGIDPNDRRYSRDMERLVRRMDPRDLDALLRADDDERTW